MVRNLLFILHKIQPLWDGRVILVLIFPNLHQYFYHVLDSMTDGSLVQHVAKAIVDKGICFWRIFRQECTDFAHETDCNLDGIIGGTFQKKYKDFQRNNFVRQRLVHEMGNEGRRGVAHSLHKLK